MYTALKPRPTARAMPAEAREAWLESELTAAFEATAAGAGLVLTEADRTLLAFDRKLNAQGLAYAAGRASA